MPRTFEDASREIQVFQITFLTKIPWNQLFNSKWVKLLIIFTKYFSDLSEFVNESKILDWQKINLFFQANLKKHLEKVQSSEADANSSSEESSEEQELLEESNEIIEKVFNAYDLKNIQDSRTKEALIQSISSGSCLICISAVKKKDQIWSCTSCYCSFHMNCIQRWARDSIYQV